MVGVGLGRAMEVLSKIVTIEVGGGRGLKTQHARSNDGSQQAKVVHDFKSSANICPKIVANDDNKLEFPAKS
jgi:hypothetical protein